MSYEFEIIESLEKKLKKIRKKDKVLFEAVRNKIAEMIQDTHHYKPLR